MRFASLPLTAITSAAHHLHSENIHFPTKLAATLASNCVITNAPTSLGRIPAKVFVKLRASVTAGLANEVEAVNQYAATMYKATIAAMHGKLRLCPPRTLVAPWIVISKPKVATNSAIHKLLLALTVVDCCTKAWSNIACAKHTPSTAPVNCASRCSTNWRFSGALWRSYKTGSGAYCNTICKA